MNDNELIWERYKNRFIDFESLSPEQIQRYQTNLFNKLVVMTNKDLQKWHDKMIQVRSEYDTSEAFDIKWAVWDKVHDYHKNNKRLYFTILDKLNEFVRQAGYEPEETENTYDLTDYKPDYSTDFEPEEVKRPETGVHAERMKFIDELFDQLGKASTQAEEFYERDKDHAIFTQAIKNLKNNIKTIQNPKIRAWYNNLFRSL